METSSDDVIPTCESHRNITKAPIAPKTHGARMTCSEWHLSYLMDFLRTCWNDWMMDTVDQPVSARPARSI